MKKCPKCGTILDDSKKKCYMCGTMLSKGSNDFSDTFDTQTGSVNSSFNSVFENSDFLFNNNSNNNHGFDVPDNAFFDAGMDKLNSMQYDVYTQTEVSNGKPSRRFRQFCRRPRKSIRSR